MKEYNDINNVCEGLCGRPEEGGRERVVVIGGGFAGLAVAKGLDLKRYEVVLVDRNNFHSFPPLFYQIASAGIDPIDISFPFRKELRRRMREGVRYVLGEVSRIDAVSHEVHTGSSVISYDKLIIATGSTNNYFGNDALSESVYSLKSASEALRCRNDVLKSLELASTESDAACRRRLLSFVVVGGGAAGVEVAGALGELKRYIIKREYPRINPGEVTITIVEGSRGVLRAMGEKSSADAYRALKSLMVDVRLGHNMKSYDNGVVTLEDGSQLEAGMVIWTAGVRGEFVKIDGAEVAAGHGGRYVCDRYNRVKGVDDIYAVGDVSLIEGDPVWEHGHPQMAQPAIQQARNLVRNLNEGSMRRMFEYHDRGTMATIGRNRAVADVKGVHLSGFVAWLMWMAVHLISLLGMRNKLSVLMSWMWSYFTYTAGARVMLRASSSPRRHEL